jgi:hypothetical protein
MSAQGKIRIESFLFNPYSPYRSFRNIPEKEMFAEYTGMFEIVSHKARRMEHSL